MKSVCWLKKLCVCVCVCIAYLSLSMSLTFLFARHCLTIISRVEALEGVRPAENRSARGRRRTRHRWSLGSWEEKEAEYEGRCYFNRQYQSTSLLSSLPSSLPCPWGQAHSVSKTSQMTPRAPAQTRDEDN